VELHRIEARLLQPPGRLGDVLAGVHIEGPWIAERCRGGHAAEYLRTPKREDVENGVLRMIDEDPGINGNLTGSAVTMNVALKRLCEYAELSIGEGIRWGTINPAATLGIDHVTGSIKVGKYADIAVIDNDFNIYMTMVKGSIAFNNNTI
jgi:N-acetylglucosamine-6-phosphate deacetylase